MIPEGCVKACPACRYRDFPADESDKKKQAWTNSCLSTHSPKILPLLAPARRWGYRRKAVLHAESRKEGWAFGMLRRRGRESEFIPVPECPLHAPELNERLSVIRSHLPRDLPLAFVLASGSIFTLVLKARPRADWRERFQALEAPLRASGIEGLQLNWNPGAGRRVVSSRHQEVVFGPSFLHDGEGFYGALSFRQQIPELERKAQSLAEDFLAGAGESTAVDLYSGAGSTLALWERRGWRAVGVELVGEACAAAQLNAPGSTILKGRVEQRLPQLDDFLRQGGFVLFTNPPRDGHEAGILAWILKSAPARLAYLSCNQRSLARDLEILSQGYELHSLQPFDFFPQTDHVESLALLERRQTAPRRRP